MTTMIAVTYQLKATIWSSRTNRIACNDIVADQGHMQIITGVNEEEEHDEYFDEEEDKASFEDECEGE